MNSTANKTTTALSEWVYYEQIVYSGIIALVGIPGNMLIILVFAYSQDKTSTHYMVFAMAINDLLGSIFCPAFSIMHQIHGILSQIGKPWLHRVSQYFAMVTNVFSSWLLSIIAIDRTRRPHSVAFTISRARWVCVIVCSVVPTITGPAFFTLSYDISIGTCIIDSECEWFIVSFIIAAGTFLSFLITSVAYLVVALAIFKRLKNKLRRRRAARLQQATGNILCPTMPIDEKNDKCRKKVCGRNVAGQPESSLTTSVPIDVNQIFVIEKVQTAGCSNDMGKAKWNNQIYKNTGMDELLRQEHKKVNRTTLIMFLITSISISTFITLFTSQNLLKDNLNNAVKLSMVIGHITRKSYTINCIANPLLYVSMRSRFRESAGKLFQRR